MIKRVLLVMIMVFSMGTQAENPAGFLWYNVPKPELKQLKKPSIPFNTLSYTDRDAVLSFYTMEALHKVRFTHRVEDERAFLAWQHYWLNESRAHGELNQRTLLQYPEFDYSVTHPTSALGSALFDSLKIKKDRARVQALARTHGMLFFYRANNPYDQKQIPIVRDFCKENHFSLIPISVDGAPSRDLPRSRLDNGQADALGVRFFPALLLVNPKTRQTNPVAYGLTTQDVLTRHLVAIATDFKGEAG
jgi:conjugal transfer pilus assembly protein TraF